ncbi:hypothetical protein P3G55_15940 [Leptospira sp. 96542]|nr:hypothetical protein [Leptospira sp. 96542]
MIDMQDGLAGGGLGLSIATANWKLAGNATNLASLSVAGTSNLGGNVSTTGTQTYTGAVTLAGAAGVRTLTATSVGFGGSVNAGAAGQQGLKVTGSVSFAGAVGASLALGSLEVTGASSLGADVTTTGAQTYTGAVTLTGAATLRTSNSNIGFGSTVNGAQALELDTGSGLVSLGGAVGGTTALGSLKISSGALALGQNITTTGAQVYDIAGSITGAGTLTGGSIVLEADGDIGTGTAGRLATSTSALTVVAGGSAWVANSNASSTTLALAGSAGAALDVTHASGHVNIGSGTNAAGTAVNGITAGSVKVSATASGARLTVNQSVAANAGTAQLSAANMTLAAGVTATGGVTLQGSGTGDLTAAHASGANTWLVTGNGAGSLSHAGGTAMNFSGFATLAGGDDVDTFEVSGAHAGAIQGRGGDDVLRLQGSGTLGSFDGGNGSDTYDVSFATGTRTLVWGQGFSNVEHLIGNGDVLQGSASAGTNWNLNDANGGTIGVGASSATFTGFTQVNSGTGGENVFIADGDYAGTVQLGGNNRWDFTAGKRLTQGSVTGSGSLTIAQREGQTGKSNFSISSSDLHLPNLAGFTGNLVIGGTLTPPTLPLGGSSNVVINANRLTVADALSTGGSVVLLGSDIELTGAPVTSGGSVSLIAGGSNCNGCAGLSGTGDLVVSGATTVNASSGRIIAARGIQNASTLNLRFNGGDFELAVAAGQEETSQPSSLSTARSIPLSTNTQAFITNLNLQLVSVSVSFANPAAAMLGVRAIEVIDLAVFEEDLTLFGRVGEGVALAFAQCEEVEGCTPNVTLEELDSALSQIQLNIQQLEAELMQTKDPERRKQVEALLGEYRGRQKEYAAYRTDLADFTGFEAQFEDEFGKAGATEIDMEAMEREVKVVETIYTRVRFLENLRFNQERRKLFAERTGLDLSDQRLTEIIDSTLKSATRAEARIERMLQGKNEVE